MVSSTMRNRLIHPDILRLRDLANLKTQNRRQPDKRQAVSDVCIQMQSGQGHFRITRYLVRSHWSKPHLAKCERNPHASG
jgi:hypothetical protein